MRGLATAALVATATANHVPAFMWGERADIGGRGDKHMGEVSGTLLAENLAHILSRQGSDNPPFPHFLKPRSDVPLPEVQLVFSVRGLTTDLVRQYGGELVNVERIMHKAWSSFTFPFVSSAVHTSPLFEGAARVGSSDVAEYLKTHPEIFTDGATDIIVVNVPMPDVHSRESLKSADETVGQICDLVSERSDGKYAALLTGDGPGRRLSEEALRKIPLKTAPKEEVAYLHITTDLYVALAVSLFLLIIFFSGFCCLFSLQTPRKFDDTYHGHAHGAH